MYYFIFSTISSSQDYNVDLTLALTSVGAILMLFGLVLSFQTIILLKHNKAERTDIKKWYFIFVLVLFFQIAYFTVIFLLYNNIISLLLISMGVIFLFGSLFVILLSYLSKKTLSLELKRRISFERFVPKEFLQQLAKKNFGDIVLGDQIEKEMTVMVTDIRSFTTLSENMKPNEIFQFLNAYLNEILPVIKNNFGFIDKFLGDGMLVIFPKEPKHAVQCAIEMFQSLREWDKKRDNNQTVNIGIGINFGKMILGTIGSKERMENTVISDVVNVASRLEPLNKRFGTGIIITKPILNKIEDDAILSRSLGKVRLRGKYEPIEVVEVYSIDSNEQMELKNKTLTMFSEAVNYLARKNVSEAKKLFSNITQINAYDKPAHFYLNWCAKNHKGKEVP